MVQQATIAINITAVANVEAPFEQTPVKPIFIMVIDTLKIRNLYSLSLRLAIYIYSYVVSEVLAIELVAMFVQIHSFIVMYLCVFVSKA